MYTVIYFGTIYVYRKRQNLFEPLYIQRTDMQSQRTRPKTVLFQRLLRCYMLVASLELPSSGMQRTWNLLTVGLRERQSSSLYMRVLSGSSLPSALHRILSSSLPMGFWCVYNLHKSFFNLQLQWSVHRYGDVSLYGIVRFASYWCRCCSSSSKLVGCPSP
jgi:hypothetical protein